MTPVARGRERAGLPVALVVLATLALGGCGDDPVTADGEASPGVSVTGGPSSDASGSASPSGAQGSGAGAGSAAGPDAGSGGTAAGSSTGTSARTLGSGTAGATGAGAPVPWETGGQGMQQLPAALPSAPSGPAKLSILLDDGFGVRSTWTLTCEPAGGTHPTPAAACGVLGAKGAGALPAPSADAVCSQQYGGPQKAKITGSWRGRSVSAELSLENGCQIARWTALLGLLPPAGVPS